MIYERKCRENAPTMSKIFSFDTQSQKFQFIVNVANIYIKNISSNERMNCLQNNSTHFPLIKQFPSTKLSRVMVGELSQVGLFLPLQN